MVSDIVKQIIEKSFPSGAKITHSANDVKADERFWVIPGNNGPRWLIPYNYIYGSHFFKNWRPYGFSSILKWKFLYMAYRSGQLGKIPGVSCIGITVSAEKNWTHLGWKENTVPIPSIYIGTPGITQKAVISLINSSTRQPVSVAKVPLGEQASNSILHEYDVLQKLVIEGCNRVAMPLFVNRNMGIAVQSSIEGELSSTRFATNHMKYLKSLERASKSTTILYHAIQLKQSLKVNELISDSIREKAINILDGLNDTTELPSTWVHGDFVPWNITVSNQGEIVALDWEEAQEYGLPFYDFFYFHHLQAFLLNKPNKTQEQLKNMKLTISRSSLIEIEKYTLVSMMVRLFRDRFALSYFEHQLGVRNV